MENKTIDFSNWSQITREERYFCAHLFFLIRNDLRKFLEWFEENKYNGMDLNKRWEIGYEVCFYRDYRKAQNKDIHGSGFSQKRTFDLALFADDELIIFEAKVHEDFDNKQVKVFSNDMIKIPELLEKPINIRIYALAASSYFANSNEFKAWDKRNVDKPGEYKCFDGNLTWKELADFYQDDILYREVHSMGRQPLRHKAARGRYCRLQDRWQDCHNQLHSYRPL